jgi:hypothetical protein
MRYGKKKAYINAVINQNMAEIIELLFKYIDSSRLPQLIEKISSESTLERYEMAGDKDLEGTGAAFNTEILDAFLSLSGGVLYLRFFMLKYNGSIQNDVHISVYKYDNGYDFIIAFDERKIRQLDLSEFLKWARLLAADLNTKDFFVALSLQLIFSHSFFPKAKLTR